MRAISKAACVLAFASAALFGDFNSGFKAFQDKDYATALREWQAAATQGDAKARNALGYLYEHGLGVTANPQQALKWYTAAAEQNYGPAEYNLGLLYRKGAGVPANRDLAVSWLTKAAANGVAEAQLDLGNILYDKGNGNPKQAMHWWEMAANKGVPAAAFNLGFLYANGKGVQKDDAQAVHWYRLAAKNGYAPARDALKVLHANPEQQVVPATAPERGLFGGSVAMISDPGPGAIEAAPAQSPNAQWPGTAASGFFVDANGDVLTDAGVAQGCGALFVRTEKEEKPARLIAADRNARIAIVRASEHGSPLALGDESAVSGNASVIGYRIQGTTAEKTQVRDGAPDTGGPVIDSQGAVSGYELSRMAGKSEAAAAVPVATLRAFLSASGVTEPAAAAAPNPAASVVLVECKSK